jgi:DNA (cytosine-5)-methyltransferase 1
MDLFAGCGGLALGFEVVGMGTVGYEMKPDAVATYRSNLRGHCEETTLTVGEPGGDADVVIGGPPCQPFSQFGYQRGMRDLRDGFPIFLDAVNRIRPKIAVIENVRGLLFRNKDYLHRAVAELQRFGYAVDARLLKAMEYGVPQKRERVVVVASKVGWEWPERVVDEPVTAGIALGPLAQQVSSESRFLTPGMDRYVEVYEKKSSCIRPRDLHLDQPARTVTCRNLGGATADMLRIAFPGGKRRMLHLREAARLQGFPDWFEFSGTEYERMEQIGNAVAPLMSLAIARQVMRFLETPAVRTPRRPTAADSVLDNSPKSEKIDQAQTILREAGVALRQLTARGRERAALCLLGVAQIRLTDPWSDAKSHLDDRSVPPFRSREILAFRNEHYQEGLSPGSYDDVRRKDLALLANAGLVAPSAKDAAADTNDGTRGYALTLEGLRLLRSFRTPGWEPELARFRDLQGGISDRLAKAREMQKVPVTLPGGNSLLLSPGPHNDLQKALIEEFLPRFSKGARILYVGDTDKKDLVIDRDGLEVIGMPVPKRGDRLPDIVAYEDERNWIFLVEAVHSSNPVNDDRHRLLTRMAASCAAGKIFVTAFLTKADFRKWATRIAWETEVWIAEHPDHLIHFDGKRFLGPYEVPEES